jgi:glycosyltransferase involved in cell wall biosynthesis
MSVARQTSRPAEIILVDDGSPLETRRAIQALAALHGEWIRTVSMPRNSGAGAARNAGWAIAGKPYVAFLDADDTWHPEKIRIQHGFMESHPEVALSGHRLGVSPRQTTSTATRVADDYAVSTISRHSLLVRNAFSTPTVMVRREISMRFDEVRRHAEDLFLWQRIAFARLGVARLELTLAYVHKPLYGAAGLSADLWRMEAAELSNLVALYRRADIGALLLLGSTAFSFIKFVLRVIRVRARRLVSGRDA